MASPPLAAAVPSSLEPPKRKRGRPRKYPRPEDGAFVLGVPSPTAGGVAAAAGTPLRPIAPKPPQQLFPSEKRGRGRPPGSGKKNQLPQSPPQILLGLPMPPPAPGAAAPVLPSVLQSPVTPTSPATGGGGGKGRGAGFTPRLITVGIGDDVAGKVLAFSQQGPRAVCVLSANGSISSVTLRHDSSFGGNTTYEGKFEILSLSGSFLYSDVGGTRSRSGGLSISLAAEDGKVVGGSVSGLLVAASPVQIVLGSFTPDV